MDIKKARTINLALLLAITATAGAQQALTIHTKDGQVQQVLTSDIDSITYKKTDVTMDITVEVDQENATVNVVPSDKEQTYVAYLVLKEEWDKYKKPGENTFDTYLNAQAEYNEVSKDVVVYQLLGGPKTGDSKVGYKNLGPLTEYVAFAVAVDGSWHSLSDVAERTFTTGQRPQSDNQISISVTDISDDAATVTVTTTNDDTWWPVLVQLPDDIFDDDRKMRQLIYDGASSGIEPLKTGNLTWEYWLSPGTQYGIAVAGVDETGYPNTAIVRKVFTTTGTPVESSPKLRVQGTKKK